MTYRRDAVTWAAFGALFGFGFLNALLGPALPYLRAEEGISYVVGALHQVAYAIGGGLAGVLAARDAIGARRTAVIGWGLVVATGAALAVGYGGTPVVTIGAAFVVSLAATTALIRLWAVLADRHGELRAVAMTEGEVAVSFAGIATPLLIGALAATALGWRFAFVAGGAVVVGAAIAAAVVGMPDAVAGHEPAGALGLRAEPTLVVVAAIVAFEFALSLWLASYLDDDVGLGRGTAVAVVSVLYAANLAGRLLTSRLARRTDARPLLAGALAVCLAGTPLLLLAGNAPVAVAGVLVAGTGMGALFPLASSLHVRARGGNADVALGEVLTVAALGQMIGPLAAGAIAQGAGLRAGLLVLPALVVIAAAALRR